LRGTALVITKFFRFCS